ncbi:phospholipid carrier-dependent glycosyltransferase [Leucobacter sp. NPDC077196]|uniref:dolichyl-phosphate-mannose--protein mannosyltransferase n=1 Tax=Leucobacter sp. NPDC077196 TaxID=3154959 RepID=UPI00343D9CFE
MTRSRWLLWLAPALVLGIAAALRFWALGRPGTLVFDELYYVRDAISQLAHGFPTTWPDDEPDMSGSRALGFTDDPSNAVHPPLGKWLIGLGILAFGPGSGWGWRSAVALAGVLTVAVTMLLGWRITRSFAVACVAGLLLAVDGVHVVLTRVGLLDGFLALAVAFGALCIWLDMEWTAARSAVQDPAGASSAPPTRVPVLWHRPWLLAAAAAFGAAASIKWSGLYPLAAFLIFITVRDLVMRLLARERHAVRRATRQAALAGLVALPTAVLVYLVSWAGWILHPGGWARTAGEGWWPALLQYHSQMLEWHRTLSAPHPYASHPLTWPLALRPTGMYETHWGSDEGCPWSACVAAVSPLPNPLVTWGGVVALLALVCVIVVRARRGPDPVVTAGMFVVVGYLSGWLPWVLTVSRSAVFQFYTVVLTPFSALALALALALLCRVSIRPRLGPLRDNQRAAASAETPNSHLTAFRSEFTGPGRGSPETMLGIRIAVAIFLAACVALAALFFPTWSGAPMAEWFWRAHLWLPGWQ